VTCSVEKRKGMKMKKYIAVFALMSVTASYGNIFVAWQGLDGFVKSDGDTPMLDGGGSSVAILVFSPSGSFFNTLLSPGSHIVGDEQILGLTDLLWDPADSYGFVSRSTIDVPFEAGFLYARVFDEGTTSDPSSVVANLWYYQSPMVAAENNITTNPTEYNVNTGSAGFAGFDTDVLNLQVIPEPSVMALLGLGGLVLAIRRRRMAA
jgi:hypothetical protein